MEFYDRDFNVNEFYSEINSTTVRFHLRDIRLCAKQKVIEKQNILKILF